MFERCRKRVELYIYVMWLFGFWSQLYPHIIPCCCWGKQQTVASAISVNRDLWKLHLFIIWESLLWAERRNSVLFSNCCLILITSAYFFWVMIVQSATHLGIKTLLKWSILTLTKLHFFCELGCKVDCHDRAMSCKN